MNAVVREKKKFENMLDDSVAGGLNTGTQLLMNQVRGFLLTRLVTTLLYSFSLHLHLHPVSRSSISS